VIRRFSAVVNLPSLARARETSRIWAGIRTVRAVVAVLSGYFEYSATSSLLVALRRAVQGSVLVSWLLAEPDVVTVDLRDLVTVAPVLALLDRVVEPLATASDHARTNSALTGVEETVRAAPVQVTSALVLAVALGRTAVTWSALGPDQRAAAAFVAALALIGLRVTASWEQLVESNAGRLVAAFITPPDSPDESR